MRNSLYSFLFLALSIGQGLAQSLQGVIIDAENNEPVIGANVVIKGTTIGTTTDFNGKFVLNTQSTPLPFTVQVSFIGYQKVEREISSLKDEIEVRLTEDKEMLAEVSVIEQRLSEKQRSSALTVEALDNLAIKETPAANFYEALGNLKGVDLTSASIGFKIINTRGFNSTSPVRSLQLIDGVDNQAPGLNFSLGNFLGASELDIANVDIIAGASTAFYGPGAFNGVISMTTKDPFLYQGLSAMVKVGERNLTETAVRYAEAFKLFNKEYEDLAFKINLFYLRANDWEATNYNPVDDSPVGADNPGRYDAVNIYGDENLTVGNDYRNFVDVKDGLPGVGIFYRPGYKEEDLLDYDTRNFKGNLGLHYKTRNDVQLSYTINYGTGTTVYQGENRFSLNDIRFMQNVVEAKKKDRFFVRAYSTVEDAGNSYDAVLTAFKMNNASLGDERAWYTSYVNTWVSAPFRFARAFQDSAGFNVEAQSFDSTFYNNEYQQILRENRQFLTDLHDSSIALTTTSRPVPGTAEYDSLFQYITTRTFTEGGSRFYDRSRLYHVMGEYQFNPYDWVKVRLGGNYRIYRPDSRGNIFDEIESVETDSVGEIIRYNYRTITNEEFGAYLGLEKDFLGEVLKANATLRMDKNQNFDYLFSPAASLVWTVDEKNTLRFSVGRAIRNPTLQDQYLRYDVGRAILLGNINGFDSLVTISSFDDYRQLASPDRDALDFFNVQPIQPERVTTAEIGYRGSLFKRLFIDLNYFYSWYTNFIGFQFGIDPIFDATLPDRIVGAQAYRISANAEELVTTQGFNFGFNFYFDDIYSFNGNYSFNQLNQANSVNPIVPAFNTPENKFNLGLIARDLQLFKQKDHKQGFAVTYKWVDGFVFEGSAQFTGFIPSYDMLDAQFSYRIPSWYTTLKIGASNLLNNRVAQVYGGPQVGRLAYASLLLELQ